jgi:DNA-damage-inducible protein J
MITVTETETATECIHGSDCPLHAENPHFNAVTLAAMQEAKDIASGKIPGKWYHSLEEVRKDLNL